MPKQERLERERRRGHRAILEKVTKKEKEGLLFMETEKQDILKEKILKSLKILIKGSLVIIGISNVLYYCVVALVLLCRNNPQCNNCTYNIFELVFLLVIPLFIFFCIFLSFSCLVRFQYNKLCGISNKEDKENKANQANQENLK